MTPLESHVREAFSAAFGSAPDCIARAPGRVNLIGEHTDYNDGFVLPAAIGAETLVAVRRRADRKVNVFAANLHGASTCFDLDGPIEPSSSQPWSNYLRGMLVAMLAGEAELCGADVVVTGSIPRGSGLSSSASFCVATGTAFNALAELGLSANAIAQLAQAAECDFVGMRCGIMDQLASAGGQRGHALLIDCRSFNCEPVALPPDLAIVLVQSGIVRGLVDGAYNERRTQCEQAAFALGVPALRDADLAMLDAAKQCLDPLCHARARHVISENDRTTAAANALRNNNLVGLGQLMAQSHASMRDDFAITLPPIDALVELLQQSIGDEGGARMTGGGFGGAVVALMPKCRVGAVIDAVNVGYRSPLGDLPTIMIEQASAGASMLA
jgi:galactokinase